MFTLYVGDNDVTVAENAKKEDTTAYLIDHANWDQQHQGVAYTSLSDLPNENEFAKLFREADTIVYSPPLNDKWSDGKAEKSMQKKWTEHYLTVFSFVDHKKIINFNAKKDINDVTVPLEDVRKVDSKQLWCAGCSFTYGVGVDIEQRYSDILSKKLDLSMSSLSASSSSILWAADQILRSDVRPDDTLVWGITSPNRFPYYDEETETRYHLVHSTYARQAKEIPQLKSVITENFFADFNLTFLAVNQILQVVTLCRSKNIKLLLAGLLPGNELASYLTNLPEYLHLEGHFGLGSDRFIDLGTDNEHPGIKMHQWYSDEIFARLTK